MKNRCFVQAGADPLIRMVADRVGTNRPPVPELPPIVPGPRTGTAAAPPAAAWDAFRPPTPTDPPADPVVVLRPVDSVLMAPVGPAGSVAPALVPPPARPAPAVVTGRPGEVLTAATAVRDANPRFAALTLEMQGGTLTIGGSAARASDAWELAQALRRVPGVARVAVGAVDVR